MEIINVTDEIIEINVTEEVINIQAPTGAYPFPNAVNSVFGRVGNVVAQEGDYTLTQLGDVTITSPTNNQVLKYNGTQWVNGTDTDTGLTSVGLSMPSAFSVANSPLTANGTLSVTGAGTTAQYVRGDGSLATFPTIAQEAQRLITEVYNSTGATLTKGSIVYINGGQGNLPTVTKAIATGDSTSAQTYGVVQSDITNMNNGFVVAMGSLTDLDTQIYPVGTQLYLSGTTAGAWTSTKPYAPIHLVYVGIVVRSHPTQGVVEIRIQNGYELDELHDVSAQSPTNGDILQYVAATDLWTKAAGTTTNIAEGTNLYFTDARARAAITLTTTGTSGAATYSGGTLNIPQYQGVLTNPVTGTGTSGQVAYFNGTSSITSNAAFAFTPTSQLLVNNSVTAASAIARGTNLTPTLTAAANFDVLVGLEINPTFTNGAFTNVNQIGLRINGGSSSEGTALSIRKYSNAVASTTIAGSYYLGLGQEEYTNNSYRLIGFGYHGLTPNRTHYPAYIGYQERTTSGSTFGDIIFGTRTATTDVEPSERMRIFSTGNVGINTSGTDAGFRLDVNGTARVSTNISIGTKGQFNTFAGQNNVYIGNSSIVAGNQGSGGDLYICANYYYNGTIATNVNAGFSTLIGLNPNNDGKTLFQTSASNTAGATVALTTTGTIFQTGNWLLGTGTTDAGYKLDVNGTARVQTSIQSPKIYGGSGVTSALQLTGTTANGTATAEAVQIFVGNNGATRGITILNNGNTSIGGIPSASYKLDVTGALNVAGNISTNNNTGLLIRTSGGTITDVLYADASNNVILGSNASGWNSIQFRNGSATAQLTLSSGGDLALGTTTFGTATKFTLGGSETASSAIARGGLINTTLVAAANNDVLVGLDINPTFTNGAFTGVTNYAIRANGLSYFTGPNYGSFTINAASYPVLTMASNGTNFGYFGSGLITGGAPTDLGIRSTGLLQFAAGASATAALTITSVNAISSPAAITLSRNAGAMFLDSSVGNAIVYNISGTGYGGVGSANTLLTGGTSNVMALQGTNGIQFITGGVASTNLSAQIFASTGNVLIQRGGTFTDAGFRLDVNGIARVQDNLTVSNNRNATTGITISNTTSGTSSASQLTLTSNSNAFIGKFSSSTSAFRIINSSDLYLLNQGVGDIAIQNDVGNIKFNTTNTGNIQAILFTTGNFAVGTSTDVASAVLQATSTTKGFLPPRGTNAQRNAISSPAVGLIFYCTDATEGLYIYTSSGWKSLTMT